MALSYERRREHRQSGDTEPAIPIEDFLLLESDPGTGTDKLLLESDPGTETDALLLQSST